MKWQWRYYVEYKGHNKYSQTPTYYSESDADSERCRSSFKMWSGKEREGDAVPFKWPTNSIYNN